MILNAQYRQKVYDFYRSKLDKRYPKGYKILNIKNTKKLYLKLYNSNELYEMQFFLNFNENIEGVSIWSGSSNFQINIGTVSKGPRVNSKEIINSNKFIEVKVDYEPLLNEVFKKTSQGHFITLSDSTAVIPDPSNDLSESEWYLGLKTGYIDVNYTDLASKDAVDTFGDLMGQL